MPSDEELRTLLACTAEVAELDFKSKFEVADASDWLEIIKDIAAIANSGGGTILIGINDDGTPSGADVAGALAIDPADLTNRIHTYTSTHFHGFEFIECEHGRKAAWTLGRGAYTPVVSAVCFLNTLAGDVHAHVTRGRHRGDEKNGI
jgi:Putative DNA-binding domain